MLVNLIGADNGVGLTRDAELMAELLAKLGHVSRRCEWLDESSKADLNIFLELFDPKHLDSAPRNIGIFNLEWFQDSWRPFLDNFDQLWAKSTEAYEWYQEQHLDSAVYTGFASRDLFDKTIPKLARAIHVRGQSQYKNTDVVIECWRRHWAKLPPLTVVTSTPLEILPGVDQWVGHLNPTKFRELMNGHAWHVCPSKAEGWGHYIAEGLGCKGLVITTDASPMNELVLPNIGWLVAPKQSERRGCASFHTIDPDDLARKILEAVHTNSDGIAERRTQARTWWRAINARFEITATKCLSDLT